MNKILMLIICNLLLFNNSIKSDVLSDAKEGVKNEKNLQEHYYGQGSLSSLQVRTSADVNREVTRGVPTFFVVYARNATTALYLNGKKVPWQNSEHSLKTPVGVSVIKYTVSVPLRQEENVVGIVPVATDSNPEVRTEAGREETDKKWLRYGQAH